MLAGSRDGIQWHPRNTSAELPGLQGRRYPNQLLPVSKQKEECGSVVLESSSPKLYRLFCEYSMWLSADGIRWNNTGAAWQPQPTDYPVSAFFNNLTKEWQMLARPMGGDRRIAYHSFKPDKDGAWKAAADPGEWASRLRVCGQFPDPS